MRLRERANSISLGEFLSKRKREATENMSEKEKYCEEGTSQLFKRSTIILRSPQQNEKETEHGVRETARYERNRTI